MKVPVTSLLLLSSSIAFAELQLSEVLYDTPGTDSIEEWIEIYNPGCDEVDLSNYQLSDNGSTFTLSGTLAANTYYTLAKNASGFEALYGFSPDASGLSLSLGNSGDYVVLSNDGTQVDTVAWEGKVSGWDLSAKYVSLYRTTISSSSTESDWATSSIDTPSTGSLTQDCSGGTDTDLSASYDGTYYDSVTNLTGASLKAALQDLLETNHTKLSYSEVWDALQYTDEDADNTDNVILLYTRRSHSKTDRDGQTGYDNQSWNREHVWPKSLGFSSTSQYGYTDIHHIRPTDKTVNSSRSNKDYDEGGTAQGEAADTYTTSESFEPMDDVKGDVARMIFYMDVRYDGSDGNMSDLYLVDDTRSETDDPFFGVVCTLYNWHQNDAVDSVEMTRNNRIEEWQGNRNPLIDHPKWVAEFYSDQCG